MKFVKPLITFIISRTFIMLKSNKELSKQGKTYEDAINTLNSLQTNSEYLKNAAAKPKPESNMAEDAINTLNSLQTNSEYLKNAAAKPKPESNMAEVTKFLNRTGLPLEELDTLSVIHITGTNGKGTTCAYCESILRNHGLKTGFYSSPHLLDVRERIRINGKPISKEEFALHFWRVYELLDKHKLDSTDMPLYFRYLTILAFHIFVKYKVDVAILEVGIGGEYDCTNVVRKTAVAGITPIDLDHTSLLGPSLESIAWNKGGIIKQGCIAFTIEQPELAMKVLKERSLEKNCDLKVIPDNYYKFENESNIPSHVQRTNASLALAICETYLKGSFNSNTPKKVFSMELAKESIKKTMWPGRYEIKHFKKIRFFLDGAHTIHSMRVCVNWFKERTLNSNKKKILIFNLTGDRLPEVFFKELYRLTFHVVIFTPNVGSEKDTADTKDFILTHDNQLQRCNQYRNDWQQLEELQEREEKTDKVLVFPTFCKAVQFLDHGNEYDVLVTGSIHLIGAALSVLDPTLNGLLDD